MYDIIIIGAGPAGLTAALYARRADKKVLVIEKETFGGQITHSPKVENYPGFTVMSGNEFADKLIEQVMFQGAEIELDTVIMSLGTSPNPLISSTTKGLEINKRRCIVAEESNGETSKEGVYAGGDAVTGAATVILAMEAGKKGAKGIHEYLSNK